MKYTDISSKTLDELKALLKEKKTSLFELKMKLRTMQLTNPNEIRAAKKDIAKIMTAISSAAK